MTEDEAKTKWCPFVRFAAPGSVAPNRWRPVDDAAHLNPAPCRCIASECMAWRWTPLMADGAFAEAVKKAATELNDTSPSRVKAVKHVNANRADYGLPTVPFSGYCGLAGKPS